MPTFTTSREATKDEMAREIDRCHKVIADLEARAEAAEAREKAAYRYVEDLETRIAELEAALAARASVPDREAVVDAVCEQMPCACMPEARLCERVADAAIAAMKGETP
jgi:hypothetical protein